MLINELLDKDKIDAKWITNYISDFLEIGLDWANVFAIAATNHLSRLGVIKKVDNKTYVVNEPIIIRLTNKVRLEFNEEKNKFINSIKKRISGLSLSSPEQFIEKANSILQDLCMTFGQQLAEWIQTGLGKEISQRHVEKIIPNYFDDPHEIRQVNELINLMFETPHADEIDYIYRLLNAAFQLNAIKLDPEATKYLSDYIAGYELYLDSNVLLPLLINEHDNHEWISSLIISSRQAGVKYYVTEGMFDEVLRHKDVAQRIWNSAGGNIKNLTGYLDIFKLRANCYIQGFLNITRQKSKAHLTWNQFINSHREENLRKILGELDIEIVEVPKFDNVLFGDVFEAIKEEWERKTYGAIRKEELNKHEASQFLLIYERRKNLREAGKKDEVWFLSYETVFAKIYLRNPQKWGAPFTFPVSAWASFLDARLIGKQGNRKNILDAIIKGNSAVYELPDVNSIIYRKAFGDRVLLNAENDAFKYVMSGGEIVQRLEKAKQAIIKRSQEPGLLPEVIETTDAIVAEIQQELGHEIEKLKRQVKEQSITKEENVKLKAEIAKLQARRKSTKPHVTRRKRRR